MYTFQQLKKNQKTYKETGKYCLFKPKQKQKSQQKLYLKYNRWWIFLTKTLKLLSQRSQRTKGRQGEMQENYL